MINTKIKGCDDMGGGGGLSVGDFQFAVGGGQKSVPRMTALCCSAVSNCCTSATNEHLLVVSPNPA